MASGIQDSSSSSAAGTFLLMPGGVSQAAACDGNWYSISYNYNTLPGTDCYVEFKEDQQTTWFGFHKTLNQNLVYYYEIFTSNVAFYYIFNKKLIFSWSIDFSN